MRARAPSTKADSAAANDGSGGRAQPVERVLATFPQHTSRRGEPGDPARRPLGGDDARAPAGHAVNVQRRVAAQDLEAVGLGGGHRGEHLRHQPRRQLEGQGGGVIVAHAGLDHGGDARDLVVQDVAHDVDVV